LEIYTIGSTQSTAEHFFGRLSEAGVERVVDVRLSNSSQLAGFAKAQDLQYFLRRLIDVDYVYEPLLAPTQEIRDAYRKQKGSWEEYADSFMALMKERSIENRLDPRAFETPTALLCSEASADRCHRSLVVAYLAQHWDDVSAVNL
jgi:uncharacterized protein (DUF488 family)